MDPSNLLKEQEARILHAERLATTGKIAMAIAHEMRNSLTSVKMILQLELERESFPATDKEALDVAVRAVQRMETAVTDLLGFARLSPPRLRPQSINDLLQASIALIQYQFRRKRLELQVDLTPDLATVQGDPDRLKEVFINLLLNAAQATPEEGTITVFSRPSPGGDGVEIGIDDTGPGIPDEYLQRIFDPFFTTRPDGTGMGLSMVRHTVEGHGGTISVINRPDGGTRFTIWLPIHGIGSTKTEL